MIKMGIMGAGSIAGQMAATINQMDSQMEVYAIAARDLDRAKDFGKKYGCKKAYGSYEEMLQAEDIDLVYVALPHSHHYKYAKMSLEAGKNVLCEKAFTVNAEQAREIIELAEKKGLFLTEGLWSRYMPSRKIMKDIIESGVIGEAVSMTGNLGYNLSQVKRLWDPNLAGGALLDLGVYLINFARMMFGENMTFLSSSAVLKDGVDVTDSFTMVFDGTKTATMQCSAYGAQNRAVSVSGTKGYMEVVNVSNPQSIKVYDKNYIEIADYPIPEQISGYEYEIEACIKAMEEHALECPQMPHAETIRIMEIMDEMRQAWGYEIPLLA